MGLAPCEVGNSITGQCETNSLEQSCLNELSIMKEMLYMHTFQHGIFLGKKKKQQLLLYVFPLLLLTLQPCLLYFLTANVCGSPHIQQAML